MRLRATALAILAGALLCGGCLFEPRDVEFPGGVVINYLAQDRPENVRENIQIALNNTDAAGYDRQIAEDFVYEPDGDTESAYPGVDWTAWDRAQEIAFITDFFNTVEGVEADLRFDELKTDWSGSQAELQYVYRIGVSEGGASVVYYMATVTLEFRLDGTFWVLTRWYDEAGGSEEEGGLVLNTLGQRRGLFATSGGG